MSAKHVFVDTNILVYAHDSDCAEKHVKAANLVKSLYDRPYPPAISTQVLQELIATLNKNKLDKKTINKVISIYYDWEIIPHTVSTIMNAFEIWDRYNTSWWDSLIVASAIKSKVSVIYSEDLQDGQVFDGVKVINPLTD